MTDQTRSFTEIMEVDPIGFAIDIKQEPGEDSDISTFSPVTLIYQLSELCRICAQTSSDMVEIYSYEGIERGLEEKISFFLPIEVTRKDVLPLQVCMQCVQRLDASHCHAQTCATANITLQSMLGKEGLYDADSPIPCSNTNYSDIEYYSELDNCYNLDQNYSDTSIENITENHYSPSEYSNHSQNLLETRYTASDVETILSEDLEVTTIKRHYKLFNGKKQSNVCSSKNKNIIAKNTVNPRRKSQQKSCSANLQCTECDKLFFTFLQLKEHYSNIHQLMGCTNCEDVFRDHERLTSHVALQHPFIVNCRICDTNFKTETLLVNHFSKNHSLQDPYVCALCNLSFKCSSQLSVHEFSSHRQSYTCQKCNNIFFCIEKLNEHNKFNHLSKTYDCGFENCNYSSTCKKRLKNHIIVGHLLVNNNNNSKKKKISEVKKTCNIWKCNDCPKHFNSKHLMEQHVLEHFSRNFYCTMWNIFG